MAKAKSKKKTGGNISVTSNRFSHDRDHAATGCNLFTEFSQLKESFECTNCRISRKRVIKKKIHDGVLYDMKKSELIYTWNNGHNEHDRYWLRESLFRTQKRHFFLFGESGDLERYGIKYSVMSSCGDKIIPMRSVDALSWLEKRRADTDLILRFFPDVETYDQAYDDVIEYAPEEFQGKLIEDESAA